MDRGFALSCLVALGCGTAATGESPDAMVCGSPDDETWSIAQALEVLEGGCTRFRGSINLTDGPDDLNDLAFFRGLQAVDGDLRIFRNRGLMNLGGLESLQSVGGELSFRFNDALEDLSALSALHSVGDGLVIDWTAATDLGGLDSLCSLGGHLTVASNSRLVSLQGLGCLDEVPGDLMIRSNESLGQHDAEEFAAGLQVGGSVDVVYNRPR